MYVIKSITNNDYYVNIEPLNVSNTHELRYSTYWSQFKEDAAIFTSKKSATNCIVFLHGILDDENEMIVEEIDGGQNL